MFKSSAALHLKELKPLEVSPSLLVEVRLLLSESEKD